MTAQAHIFSGTEITTGRRKPSELVAEYQAKLDAIPAALSAFENAGRELERACSIGGAYPGVSLNTGRVYEAVALDALLKSAWRHVWELYGLATIASADTKRRVDRLFENPPEFSVENIRVHFGDLFRDPWQAILKGLAEVFSSLDPVFKSHERMKVGVKGLPKRVILSNVNSYGSYGQDRIRDILNALAAYQRKPLVEYYELSRLVDGDGTALMEPWIAPKTAWQEEKSFPGRGVWLRRYANGNGHLYFGPEALRDVNMALAEFYGDVLPDCPEERPSAGTNTQVAKDLQFYRTPDAVVDRVLARRVWDGMRVLEPSCGDGALLNGLRKRGANVFGIEVDPSRATECKSKGYAVLCANFLEQPPDPEFDAVVMNPPFYGRHYAKHIKHALKWLKPNGFILAILPVTARYDHGELDYLKPSWEDLPVGSFSESGTNINTCVAIIYNR